MKQMLVKYKKTLVATTGLLLFGVVALWWNASSSSAPPYREATVARGDIEIAILATGVVQPRNRLEIKPPIPGRVEELLVNEGQVVTRGQVLAWMSSSERAALLDAARARGAEELKRWEELYRPTPVIAPITGTVILRNAEPGQTFQSQDAIFVLSDRLVVKAQVDETDIAQVRLRQRARVTLDAYSDKVMDGAVEQLAFDAKTVNNVTTYEVDILPQQVPPFMRSGMTANVSFIVASRRDVLWVPAEAVRGRGKNPRVLVPAAEPGGAPEQRAVDVGISDGRRTEITAGIAEGDAVLVPQLVKAAKSGGTSNPLAPSAPRTRR